MTMTIAMNTRTAPNYRYYSILLASIVVLLLVLCDTAATTVGVDAAAAAAASSSSGSGDASSASSASAATTGQAADLEKGGGGGRGGGRTSSSSSSNSAELLKLKNTALVFVKPHANTPQVHDLVVDQLNSAGIEILSQVDINGEEIERRQLIDNHYYSIASKATLLKPNEINVPTQKFYETFGEDWETVLKEDRACNALEACRRFDCTPSQLNDLWAAEASSSSSSMVKFGGGFYCAKLSYPKPSSTGEETGGEQQKQPQELYVFNGFFMAMRSKFVGPGKEIRCYVVQWDPRHLSWKKFRGQILGPTNPADAPSGSIRRLIYDKWNELGLTSVPDNGDNGVHASASPFEGLAERMNFLNLPLGDDDFASYLLDSSGPDPHSDPHSDSTSISESMIISWTKDPQIIVSKERTTGDDGGDDDASSPTYGSVFDELEDLDVADCARRIIELQKLQ
eukprot:CAMPEP_0113495430 /NCGR_PEP_ID=MMETSP0014_2-20120614/29607_1 /TAXON_ID=2857 /ORGANISM="Nitzschia sp." /LENGTH=453 /DNA_ID=CAMNT_0000389331 /DNA_START=89 /DNA_END=1450 /DNA_ORIENTATION=- /assembly_acc=CAM_ASM_000159